MKGPSEKSSFDGIYSNQMFVHASASLIGCIVHLQVKNGDVYQGVFRTFSHKMDIALEMAQKLDGKKSSSVGNSVNPVLSTGFSASDYTDKLIFRAEDVVHLSALDTDTDFAALDTFTDSAISSKFNGQVTERPLQAWDGGDAPDGLGGLGTDNTEPNGWDPNDMFRTNEEKYGIKSSFNSDLPGYTIALEKRNTEEYREQEARASKIAKQIESGVYHRSRNALENGDEEDRFSAVVRPDNRNAIESRKTDGNGQPEAKASKIAQENEIGYCTQSRNALQNGYEKRFNSYSRVNGARYPPRKKNPQGMRMMRSSPSPSAHPGNRSSNHSFQQHHQQSQPHRVSSPASSAPPSGYKTASSTSSASCVSTPSPRPTPSSTPTPRHTTSVPQILPAPPQQQHALPAQLAQQQPPPAASPSSMSNESPVANNQSPAPSQTADEHKINGVSEMEKIEQKSHREPEPKPLREEPKPPREMEQKLPRDMEPKPPRDMEPKPPRDMEPKPPRLANPQTNVTRESSNLPLANQAVISSNKTIDRRKDGEKKIPSQKARDDKTEGLKRFHESFKLSEDKESKEHKEEVQKFEASTVSGAAAPSAPKQLVTKEKEKPKEEEKKVESVSSEGVDAVTEAIKASSHSPAKEYHLNPNAKPFTPFCFNVTVNTRTVQSNVTVAAPAPPMQPPPPPRLHTQSPVVAVPQPHLLPGMAQPIFANMGPHYVVSATPVSVPLGSPFNPSPTIAQGPRYRRAVPMTIQQRHEMSQSVHVQAATGPPILAQPALPTPQFAIQYAPSAGMIHAQGAPQPAIGYAQMYSVMTPPRVLNPQAVGIVPTSSYGENPHVPAHLYMPHPGTPSVSHVPPGNAGQHSSSSTPQSQTPALHPAPSPVHQPPPSGPHGSHGQPPTPTGHPGNAPTPQPVIYHGHITSQHPVHANQPAGNQTHPYPASFPGTPQPIMLLPQQAVSGAHAPHPATFSSSLQNHLLHGQTPGNHAGTPQTHVLPHPPMAMIPTSAAMVHTQGMQSGHLLPHTQG